MKIFRNRSRRRMWKIFFFRSQYRRSKKVFFSESKSESTKIFFHCFYRNLASENNEDLSYFYIATTLSFYMRSNKQKYITFSFINVFHEW